MPDPQNLRRIVRFGSFEADLQEAKLTKAGLRIRLQEQPFQILVLLLEHPGQVVTREEIQRRLWAADTFVEFDDALNTAVRKLRAALGDLADNPRFVETVPRRGYRFIAPVAVPSPITSEATHDDKVEPGQVRPETPSSEIDELEKARAVSRRSWIYPVSAVAALLLAIAALGYWHARRAAFRISGDDKIVLADFVNTTGEPVFDDALRKALEVGLQQSPSINVISDRKTAVIMQQMGHSQEERMSGRTAIEVCQRAGGKVAVQGSIASLGTEYLIDLAAIRCDTGEPIDHEEAEPKRKAEVVDALGRLSAQLRAHMGESLPSIHKFNVPLEQATTPSLEALSAYSTALSTWDKAGDLASIPFFKKAIELDPNFAMAYHGLSTIYHNFGETDLARENATKAYALRNRVTETERIPIEAVYAQYVTGDLNQAVQVHEEAIRDYPHSAGAWNHLGSIYGSLGEYDKAANSLREALRMDPSRATTYANLAGALLAMNRPADAKQALDEAVNRHLQTDYLLQMKYWHAFLQDDQTGMQQALLQAPEIPGAQSLLLATEANTEAYYGHLQKARELSRIAADQLQHDWDAASAADALAEAALRETEMGSQGQARQFLTQALKLSHTENVIVLAALTDASIGDQRSTRNFVDQLQRQSPSATFMQHYWLPVIRAQADLQEKRATKAIDDLVPALELDFSTPAALTVTSFFPAYLRGEAYLAAGDGAKAVAEFQKLIDHRGILLNSPLSALVSLEMARAYARAGDSGHARQAYQQFLQLWKDADPEIATLQQARAEYLKLGSAARSRPQH